MSVNRTKDVPYLAGSSNDNKTVYIDRRVPRRIKVKRADGKGFKWIDPAVPLAIHERAEHRAMKGGKTYEQAHIENGTAEERSWVQKHGLDWKHYEEVMDGLLSHIEHEHASNPPKDLYLKPYPHDKRELLKRAAAKHRAAGGRVGYADGGAAFGVLSPQEEAERGPNILDKIVSGAGRAAANIVTFPRRYMDAYEPGQSVADVPQATQWAPEVALTMAGGAAPMAEHGALGVAGGRLLRGEVRASDLPMDTASRMQRAKEGGFYTDMPLAHGTAAEFQEFSPAKFGATSGASTAKQGVWAEVRPQSGAGIADEYAQYAAARTGGDPRVIPLLHRADRPAVLHLTGMENGHEIAATLAQAWDDGFDAVMLKNYTSPGGKSGDILVVKDPAQLRSPFAKFDPAQRSSRDLLAGIGGLGAAVMLDGSDTRADGGAVEGDDYAGGLRRFIGRAGEIAAQTWPARLAQDVWNAVKAPGNAYNSTEPVTTEQLIKPAVDLASILAGGAAPMAERGAVGAFGGKPIRAYHGSPHDFERFDISKLGTGEGSLDRGRGFYASENRAIAEPYKPEGGVLYEVQINASPDQLLNLDRRMELQSPFVRERIANALEQHGAPGYFYRNGNQWEARENHLSYLGPQGMRKIGDATSEDAAQRLVMDYYTRKAMPSRLLEQWGVQPRIVGPDQIRVTDKEIGGAAERLLNQGILGATWLQKKSHMDGEPWRSAGYPTGRNYVVFDDKIIDILRKYGVAGLSMLPPATAAAVKEHLDAQGAFADGGAVPMADGGDPGDWIAPAATAGDPGDWIAPQQPAKKSFTLADTWPARLAKSVWSAVTLPGDVMKGNVQLPSREGVPGSAPEESGQITYEPNILSSWALPEGSKWQAPGAESPFGRAVELSTIASPISAGSVMKRGVPTAPSAAETLGSEFAAQLRPGAVKEGTASAEFGIPLSSGEAAKDFGQIQFERTALVGGYGAAAQREAQKFFDARRAATEAAINKQATQFDPYGQVIAGGPVESAELVGESLKNAASAAKSAYQQRYREFSDLPGVIHSAGLEGIGQKIKGDLSLREAPVIIDDVTTPVASRALRDIEQNIDRLKIQNRADPFGQPNPETIIGVNLKGIDQTRKRLVQFQQAAMQNPADKRAVGAIIDAFDQHIENAISDGLFSGSDRALEALKEARAGFANYQRMFKPRKNDGGVGAVMDKIVNRDEGAGATAGEIANFMFGAAGTGANGLSVRLSNRLKSILGENSPEWSAIRQGMWQRLTGPADGMDQWGPQKISQRLFQFVNGSGKPLAEILYSPQERLKMTRLASALKEQVPPAGAVNTSYTAPVLARILGATADRIFGHIPGVSFLMRIGRDQIDAARQAGRVSKSLYGEPVKTGKEPGPIKSRIEYAGTTGYSLSPAGMPYSSNKSE